MLVNPRDSFALKPANDLDSTFRPLMYIHTMTLYAPAILVRKVRHFELKNGIRRPPDLANNVQVAFHRMPADTTNLRAIASHLLLGY